jgi:hypothetical protein
MQEVVVLPGCPQTEVAATGLRARDLVMDMVTGAQYVVTVFERAGAVVWVCRRGMTGRQSAGEDQRYVQKELLPPEAD